MSPDDPPPLRYHAIDEALQALRDGRIVIVVDAQERENEGDFICAAEKITPEIVSFMLRYGGGVLCAPMTREIADRLQLHALVERNTSPHQTPFLMLVDHRLAGSGVSAENRALTIQALADPQARAEDFVRPGHVNTLLARDAGVLRRAGHTEATVDLLKMAGMQPVGALIEILSSTGRGMAGPEELQALSDQHQFPIIHIEDIIRHRRLRERLVTRQVETRIPTKYGDSKLIAYEVAHEDQVPLAIVFGDLSQHPAPLVRMHSSCFTGDLIASLRCDCGDQLQMAMEMISRDGCGAIVYLPQEGRGIGLVPKLQAYNLQDQGYDTVEANHKLGFKADQRDYMVGLQILKDLGLTDIRLLTNNPKKTHASAYYGVDIRVVEQIPILAGHEKHRERYMATKRDKMGHLLPLEATSPGPALKLLPVLDLWQSQVVHGVAGQRDSYAPLQSRLGCPPEPLAVARAIRQEFGCDSFYLADLDAIRNQQPNQAAYRELIADGFELWIDAGVTSVESARQILEAGAKRIIVGLESIPDPATLKAILAACGSERIVFSLDLQGGQPLTTSPGWSGFTPLEIGRLAIATGVQQLIVLDLAQVGIGQGLSTLSLCSALRESAPQLTLVTGGGVRGAHDLQELANQGINAVLVASALHDGRLSHDDVQPWL